MLLWKRILVLVVLAPFVYLIVSRYFPEEGSRLFWTHDQVRKLSVKLQKVAHHLADVFCSLPEECKKAADAFFEFVNDILDVWETAVSIVRNVTASSPQTTYEKQRRTIVTAFRYDKSDVSYEGNATKAEEVIKSLQFESYEEYNLCDVKEGITDHEFDATVEEVAILANMPEIRKRVIKRARKFTGNVLVVNMLQFKTPDGNMVFARVAVHRNGDKLDMAYSLHVVEYDLKEKQRKPENAENLKKFSESLNNDDNNDKEEESPNDGDDNYNKVDDDDSAEISVHLRKDFLAFFHKQAIDGFVKHCDFLFQCVAHFQKKELEILEHMRGVNDVRYPREVHFD